LPQNEEATQLVVGARASSYCRSRQNVLGLREARDRCRSGRKPARHTKRVNGSLTAGGLRRVSAGARRWQKGGGSSQLGDPHHVSAEAKVEAAWFRSRFGVSGMRAAIAGGRHPGLEKRTPFTRPPRNRSWRPPGRDVALEEKRARGSRTEEATGVSEAVGVSISHGGRQRHRVRIVRSPK